MKHSYKTKGTCSDRIDLEIEDGVIKNVGFVRGCNGNLKALSRLVDGFTLEELERKCKGITCGLRNTSCADQLYLAAKQAFEEEKNPQ
ncbi:MAG: TIGR03905 family TSCPD domain-containing protein [Clostridiales bacterium]|jgi:uncharacterized protein (TIGR03905 family)|nr:TIGR03905 family TSCPD domain-containing protein [Clostridiales bacterium]